MTYYSEIYRGNICNRHLNLSNAKLTYQELQDIFYCLIHQEIIPLSIRTRTANFTNTRVYSDSKPEEFVTIDLLPQELQNSSINFIFNK